MNYLLLSTLWFIWIAKYVLFWLYLWQLKDYHVGRLFDHFRTHKGKKIIFNYLLIFKIILFVFSIILGFDPSLLLILFLVYLAESVIFLRQVYLKTFKKPVITFKSMFLVGVSFLAVFAFLLWNKDKSFVWFLGFDILTPIIVSIIVLFFQPFSVVIRNKTLRKAKDRLETIRLLNDLTVVAITGSFGKTSTKEFLTTILSKKFKVLSTNRHQNSEIGVANCILKSLKPNHQVFIAEVGAYDKGKVKEVCNILKPKIGIVTGVNEQHLALFGSLQNLLSAEGGGELAEAITKDGILAVNGDNKYCLDLIKKSNNLPPNKEKIYALNNKTVDADVWAEEIEVHKDFVSFVALNKNKEMIHFKVNVLGKHSVQNILGAILIANELGMSFADISEACKNIASEQSGMVLRTEKHGINIIDSSYSANPDGVSADLNYLSVFNGKKVVVMPCLIELGEKSSEIHEKIGRKIGKICDLAIITSKDKFKEIEGGFNETKKGGAKCEFCDNPEDIYSMITLFCRSGDAVLLEGRVPGELIKLL